VPTSGYIPTPFLVGLIADEGGSGLGIYPSASVFHPEFHSPSVLCSVIYCRHCTVLSIESALKKPFKIIKVVTIIRIKKLDFRNFYILLTVHLSIFTLVINQLDAQNFCFKISLFHASTCFEHHVLIIRRSKLYYAASGIITPIGGRPVHTLKESSLNVYAVRL